MLLRSLRARRRRTRFLVAITAATAVAAAAACGIDAVATKEFPGPPDAREGGPVVLPPKPDGEVQDGGADADASTDAPLGCPTGHGEMVVVDAGGLFFCIDATEVRNDAYNDFLKATDGGNPATLDGGSPDGCATNSTFARVGAGPDPDNFPVARIDWCDAHAFCAWAGKRMCGKQIANDASTGEWFAACTNGGATRFPYGNDYDASACNDNTTATKAGGAASCQGGVKGLFDMNGNVTELVDNCTASGCSGMGGYFFGPAVPTSGCATASDYAKIDTNPGIGFRCCADPR